MAVHNKTHMSSYKIIFTRDKKSGSFQKIASSTYEYTHQNMWKR